MNPDGYEYSRLSSDTRLWRKNRNVNVDCNNPLWIEQYGIEGVGVDLNRNFPRYYKIGDTIHTDTDNRDYSHSGRPFFAGDDCNDEYNGGTYAFSEPEAKTVHEYIRNIKTDSGVIAAIDVHSYSEVFLMPDNLDEFGFGAEKEVLMELGEAMAKAISKVDPNSDFTTTSARDIYTWMPLGPEGDIMDYWFYGEGILVDFI